MITEEKMLLIALGLMYVVSFIVAAGLYLAGTQALTVVVGGTISGALIYIAMCAYFAPHVQQFVEIEEDLDNG